MTLTYIPIASTTLSTSTATVTFSSIPQTYTDLVLRVSARTVASVTSRALRITFNSVGGTSYSDTYIYGNGSTASSGRASNTSLIQDASVPGANATSNTFGSTEVYIPNYTSSSNKQISIVSLTENNATAADLYSTAGLFRNSFAITEVKFEVSGPSDFASGSTFHLYGII